MADTNLRPVFIIGCPRSGTTWLYHILLSSGRFAIYRSESKIYTTFGPCYGNFTSARRRAKFLRDWLESEYFLRSGLDATSFHRIAMECGRSAGAMLRVLMDEICSYQHAARWADCTPDNALQIRQIKRDFNDALFIHIIRDGRDVAVSLAKQGFVEPFPWHRDAPELAAGAYWSWVLRTVQGQSRTFREDVLTLKYEDLVMSFERSLAEVSAFIGQRIDGTRVARQSIGSIATPNSSFPEQVDSRYNTSIGRWRFECSHSALQALESGIGDMLLEHDYEPRTLYRGRLSRLRKSRFMPAYSALFQTRLWLKGRTPLGRITDAGLSKLTAEAHDADPTLRPGAHIDEIRQITAAS